jgi:AcrR family transcriptional regulator
MGNEMKSKSIRTFSSNEKLVEERREQIIKCAIKIFNKKGFDGTSMRDIAAACRMTSANLYNYIAEKDDIICLIMKDGNDESYNFIAQADEALQKMGPAQALVRAIELFFRHIDNRRAGVTFLYRGIASFKNGIRSSVLEVEADETAAFQRILDKGCKEKEFVIGDTRLVADNIISLGQMWAVKHGILEKRYTIDTYIKLQTGSILRQVSRELKQR